MKKILIIITTFMSLYNYSQITLLSLENDLGWDGVAGAYYKDLNNVLDEYEGTWLYTDGTTSFKIVLVKKTMFFEGSYYEDLMIGEYQYIENGVQKINTLANLNSELGYDHNIRGNGVLSNCFFMPEDDCIEGEKRLRLGLIDPNPGKSHWATMILKKRVINGQEAIKAYLVFNYARGNSSDPDPIPSPTMPWQQEYVMFKQ